MPGLEEVNTYNALVANGPYAPTVAPATDDMVTLLRATNYRPDFAVCPSNTDEPLQNQITYRGVLGPIAGISNDKVAATDGIMDGGMGYNDPVGIGFAEYRDGTSNTIFIGENLGGVDLFNGGGGTETPAADRGDGTYTTYGDFTDFATNKVLMTTNKGLYQQWMRRTWFHDCCSRANRFVGIQYSTLRRRLWSCNG